MASSHNKDKNSDQMQKEQNNKSNNSRAWHVLWMAACNTYDMSYGWLHAYNGLQNANLDAAHIEVSPSRNT